MTILELLIDSLPDEYIDCIINNLDDKSVLEEQGDLAYLELCNLFDWDDSREGPEFWEQVYMFLLGKDKLPELPIEIIYAPSTTMYLDDCLYVMNTAGTGLHIRYDVDFVELSRSNPKSRDKVLVWLN